MARSIQQICRRGLKQLIVITTGIVNYSFPLAIYRLLEYLHNNIICLYGCKCALNQRAAAERKGKAQKPYCLQLLYTLLRLQRVMPMVFAE